MAATFPWGWWSFDLGEYRPCDGTYALYPYEGLPPIDPSLLRGDFAWLTPPRPRRRAGKAEEPARLFARAAALGLTLPPAFEKFMSSRSLQWAVPSCTACEWDLGEAPQPCRVTPGAYTIRFLRDQQDCLFWYLYVQPDGATSVLCSPIPLDRPGLEIAETVVLANSWIVAPGFEEFVYRFWIENELWELLNEGDGELTPAQRAYVEHYAVARRAKRAQRAAARDAAKKAAAEKEDGAVKQVTEKVTAKKAAKKAAAKKVAKKAVKKAAKKKAAKREVAT